LPKSTAILQNIQVTILEYIKVIISFYTVFTKENVMRLSCAVLFLFLVLGLSTVYAADTAEAGPLSQREAELSDQCNLAARNSLASGDLTMVEKTCTQAINEIDKAHPGQEYLINPILNLAFSYTLAGQFDKATPLYSRARKIRVKLYGPDNIKVKEVEKLIRNQEEIQKQSGADARHPG